MNEKEFNELDEEFQKPKKKNTGIGRNGNLIPLYMKSPEEQKRIREKAMNTIQENKQKRRLMREEVEKIISQKEFVSKDKDGKYIIIDGATALIEKLVEIIFNPTLSKFLKAGDQIKAIELILNRLGLPKQEIDMKISSYEQLIKQVSDDDGNNY